VGTQRARGRIPFRGCRPSFGSVAAVRKASPAHAQACHAHGPAGRAWRAYAHACPHPRHAASPRASCRTLRASAGSSPFCSSHLSMAALTAVCGTGSRSSARVHRGAQNQQPAPAHTAFPTHATRSRLPHTHCCRARAEALSCRPRPDAPRRCTAGGAKQEQNRAGTPPQRSPHAGTRAPRPADHGCSGASRAASPAAAVRASSARATESQINSRNLAAFPKFTVPHPGP
jgi:hypothetical protein